MEAAKEHDEDIGRTGYRGNKRGSMEGRSSEKRDEFRRTGEPDQNGRHELTKDETGAQGMGYPCVARCASCCSFSNKNGKVTNGRGKGKCELIYGGGQGRWHKKSNPVCKEYGNSRSGGRWERSSGSKIKQDKKSHGFGMLSVQQVKYTIEDEKFCITICSGAFID